MFYKHKVLFIVIKMI